MANTPKWFSNLLGWLLEKARQVIGNLPIKNKPSRVKKLDIQTVAIGLKAYATVVIPALNEQSVSLK